MRYVYSTAELLNLFASSGLECSSASPFRTLSSLDFDPQPKALTEEEKLLAAFALRPEQTLVCGRHSAADGSLYLLRIGAIRYAYTRLEKADKHVFFAYYDQPGLLRMLERDLCGFYRPNFGAYTELDVKLTQAELIVWQLIRALYALRARNGVGSNIPFTADDVKQADVALYLRNTLDEIGFSHWSDAVDGMIDEANHAQVDAALKGLEEKGILSPDMTVGVEEADLAFRLSRTALERLDDGMLIDTVWFADRTDPERPKEILFCLRRDGVLAYSPTGTGVVLRTLSRIPWEELI